MNLKTITVIGAFAAALSAQAVTVTGLSELVLGFAAPDSSVNVEIALGTAANYTALNATTVQQIGRLNVADLTTNFGASWANRSDLNWAIVGFNGGTSSNTAWASKEVTTVGVQTDPWLRGTPTFQNSNFGTKVKSVVNSLTAATANGANQYTLVVPTSVGTSWSNQVPGTALYVQSDLQNDTIMAASANPLFASGVALSDLYQMQSGSSGSVGTYIGTFGIDSQGALWFANNAQAFAIPEPSTYAMILGALTLGLVAVRRRFVKQA